jgi:hypothetical protein
MAPAPFAVIVALLAEIVKLGKATCARPQSEPELIAKNIPKRTGTLRICMADILSQEFFGDPFH